MARNTDVYKLQTTAVRADCVRAACGIRAAQSDALGERISCRLRKFVSSHVDLSMPFKQYSLAFCGEPQSPNWCNAGFGVVR